MDKFDEIQISRFFSSTNEEKFLAISNGRYFEINHPLAELLYELKKYNRQEDAINEFINKHENKYTHEYVTQTIRYIENELFTTSIVDKGTFLYKKTIIAANLIERFSKRFCFLFRKEYLISVLLITIILNVLFFLFTDNLYTINTEISIYLIIGMISYIIISSLLHELGHASACVYYGLKHGDIGIGLYLNFPVLFTDVTEIWKLKRSERCIVNIAGVYFQSYCMIILITMYFLLKNEIIGYLILIMDFGFLLTLNPFFKFDGYWIASDLLGVPNLRQRSKEVVRYVFNYLFHRNEKNEMPYLIKMSSGGKIGFVIYSILVNIFMGYYFLYIIPLFIYRFTASFPEEIHRLVLYLSNNINPPFALLRNIFSQALFMTLIVVLTFNFIKSFLKNKFKIF